LGLAIVSLIVLVLLGALAGLILTRVFGAAAARNQKRPGGGEDKGGRDLMGDDAEAKKARGRMSHSLGWALAALGILLAAVGAASSFDEVFMNDAVPLAFLGIVLGVAAYMFGAHRVGATAAVFSVAALIFLVGVSQGVLPGVERTDRNLPANEPNAQRPSGVDQRPSDASGS
jgi:hypothetical protein